MYCSNPPHPLCTAVSWPATNTPMYLTDSSNKTSRMSSSDDLAEGLPWPIPYSYIKLHDEAFTAVTFLLALFKVVEHSFVRTCFPRTSASLVCSRLLLLLVFDIVGSIRNP